MSRYREDPDVQVVQQSSPDNYGKSEKNDTYRTGYPDDVTVGGGEGVQPREEETHRALKPRQISMIAIGGAIGACDHEISGEAGAGAHGRYGSRDRLGAVPRAQRARQSVHLVHRHGRVL